MRKKLQALEAIAQQLEPGESHRIELLNAASAYAQRFLAALPDTATYVADSGFSEQLDSAIGEQPAPIGDLLQELERSVDRPGINPAEDAGGARPAVAAKVTSAARDLSEPLAKAPPPAPTPA